ncbi:MAG: SPASM domain-containing protein [Saprospiraceae bacterium]|nr:SPASM domain-containing protein [Saprospiraceae bacterium]
MIARIAEKISYDYFNASTDFIFKGFSFNNCLHKKVSIDSNGQVKNCPSFNQSFGHYNKIKLEEIINEVEFLQPQSITKQDIEECKVCEYRLVCSVCWAYLKDDSNMISKPKKCKYDPYTGVWN